ncbi:MAG: porin, partial [Rhodobacterales bacterium]|nr:porin [Rhodobacterales bacterium]
MKKLLLATSILAGTASIAAAEITFSGDARMGILNDFQFDDTLTDDTGFTSRARLAITMSGETDSGLSFGASFRADNSSSAANGLAGSVFLSGAFGKLSMGDVDGAAQSALGQVDGVGLTGLGDYNEVLYIGAGGALGNNDDSTDFDTLDGTASLAGDPTALYEYSTNGFGIYVSVTQPNYEFDDVALGSGVGEGDAYALGINYAFEGYKVGFGYESLDVNEVGGPASLGIDHWIIGADANWGDFTMKARYGEASIDETSSSADITQYAISGTYAMDALAVTAYVASLDWGSAAAGNPNVLSTDRWGIGA